MEKYMEKLDRFYWKIIHFIEEWIIFPLKWAGILLLELLDGFK